MPTVTNTDAGLEGKTLINAESGQTVTGLKTFDRDPSAPFAVAASSAVVTNLDADKVDGLHVTSGTFTLTDASGAALTFTTGACSYVKIGPWVILKGQVIYPVTADGTNAGWGGLPFTVSGGAALAVGFGGVNARLWVQDATTIVSPLNATTGASFTNANLSAANLTFSGVYLATS